jgi:hypothetical protein
LGWRPKDTNYSINNAEFDVLGISPLQCQEGFTTSRDIRFDFFDGIEHMPQVNAIAVHRGSSLAGFPQDSLAPVGTDGGFGEHIDLTTKPLKIMPA